MDAAERSDLEVKRLKELVRRLEHQNEQLRRRASGGCTGSTGGCTGSPRALPPSPACVTGNPRGSGAYRLPGPGPLTTPLRRTSLASFSNKADEAVESFRHSAAAGAGEPGEGEPTHTPWVLEGEPGEEEPSVLDEVEVLDLASMFPSEESDETWLYESSRARRPLLSALQWCRQVLDQPRGEENRRSPRLRLDRVSRWRGGVSSPSSPARPLPLGRVAGVSPLCASCTKPCSTPTHSDRPASSSSSSSSRSLHPLLHLTLSPVGPEPSPPTERTPTFLPANRRHTLRHSALSVQSSLDSEPSVSELEDYKPLDYKPLDYKPLDYKPLDYKPLDYKPMDYKLLDLTDVHVMARLQEDSLRQDYASSSSSLLSRRASCFSLPFLPRGSEEEEEEEEEEDEEDEEEEEEEEYALLPPPQPRLLRSGPSLRPRPLLPRSQTFSGGRDWRSSPSPATPCSPLGPAHMTPPCSPLTPSAGTGHAHASVTPPCSPLTPSAGTGHAHTSVTTPISPLDSAHSSATISPYMSRQRGVRAGSDKLRRSMPNLVRTPSMPSVPSPANHLWSPSLLRNSQSFDSSNGLSRLQSSIPSPGRLQNRVRSVGNFQASSSRQPLKATAYVSPTVKGPAPSPSLPGKPPAGGGSAPSASSRSGLPRPASFIGSAPRSKIAQSARSLLTPPKSLSTLSALRARSWRDGCY